MGSQEKKVVAENQDTAVPIDGVPTKAESKKEGTSNSDEKNTHNP